jgi:plasmid maintenance system killer protein
MRINDQFRLIFQMESTEHGSRQVITDIEKYYE